MFLRYKVAKFYELHLLYRETQVGQLLWRTGFEMDSSPHSYFEIFKVFPSPRGYMPVNARRVSLWLACCGATSFFAGSAIPGLGAQARLARRFLSTDSGMWKTAPDQTTFRKRMAIRRPYRVWLTRLCRRLRMSTNIRAASCSPIWCGRGDTPKRITRSWAMHWHIAPEERLLLVPKDIPCAFPDLVALLKVSKAQFGTVVFLNGVRIGEHNPCFIAAYFDVTRDP